MASIQRWPSSTSRTPPASRRLLSAAQRIARHAAAHVLEADGLRREVGPRPACWSAIDMRELLEHLVFHERQDLAEVLVLVVVRVDVDDQHVVELALHRLLAGVSEQLAGVQFLDCYASAAISNEVHDVFSCNPKYSRLRTVA